MRKGIKIRFACLLSVVLLLFSTLCASASVKVIYRFAGKDGKKLVALTFDDGPHPRYTPQILDILKEFGVCATFFAVGTNAETYPDLIKREMAEGHEVGNHSYNHYHTARMSAEVLVRDMAACSETLERITGQKLRYFRPPEGVCTPEIKAFCEERGYTIVLWSVGTRDWAHTPVKEIVRNVASNTRNGSVILMHDFTGKNSPTPSALRQIIPMLLESGYQFVTISQLLEG